MRVPYKMEFLCLCELTCILFKLNGNSDRQISGSWAPLWLFTQFQHFLVCGEFSLSATFTSIAFVVSFSHVLLPRLGKQTFRSWGCVWIRIVVVCAFRSRMFFVLCLPITIERAFSLIEINVWGNMFQTDSKSKCTRVSDLLETLSLISLV